MKNSIFLDGEKVSLVTHNDKDCNGNHGDDYGYYNTPDINKVVETKFTTPSPTNKQATMTLQVRENLKQDELAALYKYLNVTCFN